jgi:hypothetical protein
MREAVRRAYRDVTGAPIETAVCLGPAPVATPSDRGREAMSSTLPQPLEAPPRSRWRARVVVLGGVAALIIPAVAVTVRATLGAPLPASRGEASPRLAAAAPPWPVITPPPPQQQQPPDAAPGAGARLPGAPVASARPAAAAVAGPAPAARTSAAAVASAASAPRTATTPGRPAGAPALPRSDVSAAATPADPRERRK